VADVLATFDTWLPLVIFDNAACICWQWVERFLKKCGSEIREVTKMGRRGNTRPRTDFGWCAGKMARSNLPELPNTTFTVEIHRASYGKDMVLAPKQLHASYTDVTHWQELVDFVNKYRGPKELYILRSMIKCTLEQYELEEEYMGIYKHRQMITDPI
jgi:hypothetical protein